MSSIQCFLLESTGKVKVQLRRYASPNNADHYCPLPGGRTYHNAFHPYGDEPIERDAQGYIQNGLHEGLPHTDPRWPTHCACGYAFHEEDEWQRFVEEIYRRTDTGEELTLRDAPVGAMWYAWWMDSFTTPQGPHTLMVQTPGGAWCVDSQASNCTMPDDPLQEHHHCWIYQGTPPVITVSKEGITCGAGAGSIQCGDYHGFLRHGYLED